MTELATFGGGCFWCSEDAFRSLPGVESVVSGYAGGDEKTARYYTVATGTTQHRESVQIAYDPTKTSYEDLLDVYWKHIDPTDSGGQFADRGFQYTTAILYHTPEQQAAAERSKKELEESGTFEEPIATAIEPLVSFFPAEEEHQGYSKKCPLQYMAYKRGSGRAAFIKEHWEKKQKL